MADVNDVASCAIPPPFEPLGIEESMATWQTFFRWQAQPVMFEFRNVTITAGVDVAFATAIGRCGDTSSGQRVELDFRLTEIKVGPVPPLTMGFRKQDGKWRIVHEHHSIPATDANVSALEPIGPMSRGHGGRG